MKCLFASLIFIVMKSYAVNFNDINTYNNELRYHRGDYIRYLNYIWVANSSSIGKPPSAISKVWTHIPLINIQEAKLSGHYKIGQAVTHLDRYYFAIKQTKFKLNDRHFERNWVEFSHPAIGYDLPMIESLPDNLMGIDINKNGLRDDYEIYVLMNFSSLQLRNLGLAAGRLYNQVLMLSNMPNLFKTEQDLKVFMNKLVASRICQKKLKLKYPDFTGFQHKYINSPSRIKGYYGGQKVLHTQLGDEYEAVIIDDSCLQVIN